jgi:ubiquinone/menaquinone biosynthesis C-methylase UbiE/DNA-binding transcriptional ArsR family regulator
MSAPLLSLEALVETLKAVAESSRLRILNLLKRGDLTVTDITTVLGQSQPRVSRHLKLLYEAGLISRYQEGSWAYFRIDDATQAGQLADALAARLETSDRVLARDLERLSEVKAARQSRAADYFTTNAEEWDQIRSLHAPDAAVEAQLLKIAGARKFPAMLDLGTGTGRLLELFAPLYRRGIGIDMSRDMLAVARANLEKAGIAHAQVRQGDILNPPVERDHFDLVTVHQVLHFLDDPLAAIREASRALCASGRLVIVDFASHGIEALRDKHAHVRLGFSDEQMKGWLKDCGLVRFAVQEVKPEGAGQLTVKIWTAEDPRQLIAERASALETALETA